jgi:hypothetical protein
MTSALVIFATLVAGVGCGSAHSVAGLPDDFNGPGSYTVPAVPKAVFAIASVDIDQDGGTVHIYYDLPAELVGQKARVDVTGAPDRTGALELWGAAGASTCIVSHALLRCEEHLSGVHVVTLDPSAQASLDDSQRAAAKAFVADPIGVLTVPLPP